ncbi:hypothetical protein SDC9_104382 [bioreactor metagenome]|uniref:Xylose isomerase-like TIM barrel domain-containing protein n=1 Tax=bioreactor metagenome TaxID=1076179 RepID=A0A645AWN0_9ZZZZ
MSLAYMLEPGSTVRGMFDFADRIGIDGIDFCQFKIEETPAHELKRMCDDYGIAAVCHTVFNDVCAPGMTRSKWLDNAKRIIENAAVLDAGKVMFPTSGKVGVARTETRKLWQDVLADAMEFGKGYGITVSIESYVVDVEWSPFVTSEDLLATVQALPGLKVTFDSGNHFIVEDVVAAYRKLAPYIVHVHFKDWEIFNAPEEKSLLMSDGKYYRMVPLGQGKVDNAACLRTMLEDKAQLYFDLEYSGMKAAPQGIAESWAHLKEICLEN